MPRVTGTYRKHVVGEETVRAFVPHPLPPRTPRLQIHGALATRLTAASSAVERLNVAGMTVPSIQWFLYGFVRKEAVISSQIEGTQATLGDVIAFEATERADRPADVEEVCNYVAALEYCRAELSRPRGLPLCSRLLCQAHHQLMRGVRGSEQHPGEIRTSQNWIGGTRPGNAHFVPPPPAEVPKALADLDQWIHSADDLPPLVRAGLAHVQFETIHPFLDGNGRIGRLLITLLLEHWGCLQAPLLYLSLAFKRSRDEYYRRLSAVRTNGDWEGWTGFFLECVRTAADDGVSAAGQLFRLLHHDRQSLANNSLATVPAIRLLDLLPEHPMITLAAAIELLKVSKPTALKAIDVLHRVGVLTEVTGMRRDRVYAYQQYLAILQSETELGA